MKVTVVAPTIFWHDCHLNELWRNMLDGATTTWIAGCRGMLKMGQCNVEKFCNNFHQISALLGRVVAHPWVHTECLNYAVAFIIKATPGNKLDEMLDPPFLIPWSNCQLMWLTPSLSISKQMQRKQHAPSLRSSVCIVVLLGRAQAVIMLLILSSGIPISKNSAP